MATPIWPLEGVAIDSTGDMVADSLGDKVSDILANVATVVKVYPTLTDGVDVVSANADWTLGSFVEIVPASTITNAFHIHGIIVESCNRDAVFELVLYSGAGDTEVVRSRFAINGGFFGNTAVDVITGAQIAANSRIRAKVASSNGAAEIVTMGISIRYAEYGG